MTEREAEVMVERLVRIWDGEKRDTSTRTNVREEINLLAKWPLPGTVIWYFDVEWFHFRIQPVDRVLLSVDKTSSFEELRFNLLRREGNRDTGSLTCKSKANTVFTPHRHARTTDEIMAKFDQFAAQWLPLFRRGCWLSGCDIEASTHEKAEWMQGFTHEELEAWNLKI